MAIERRLGGRIVRHAVAARVDTVRIPTLLRTLRPFQLRAALVAALALGATAFCPAAAVVSLVGRQQVLRWYTRRNSYEP